MFILQAHSITTQTSPHPLAIANIQELRICTFIEQPNTRVEDYIQPHPPSTLGLLDATSNQKSVVWQNWTLPHVSKMCLTKKDPWDHTPHRDDESTISANEHTMIYAVVTQKLAASSLSISVLVNDRQQLCNQYYGWWTSSSNQTITVVARSWRFQKDHAWVLSYVL